VSAEPVPDAVVREAIARVTEGVVETQAKAGVPIPGGRAVEDWVRPIVERQVRIFEDGANVSAPRPARHESPSRITRGDVGPGARPLERDLSASPRGRAHLRPKPLPLDDQLLLGRLQLLRYWPCELGCVADADDPGHRHVWQDKLIACGDEARAIATRNGYGADYDQVLKLREKMLLDVVALSAAPISMGGLGLGDYKQPHTKMLVRLPPVAGRHGLVPIEHLQRKVQPLVVTP
jgi:hypothetical protein